MTPARERSPGMGYRVSLSVIVTSVAVALTAAAVLTVSGIGERNARRVLATEIEARLLLQARNLALGSSSPLLSDYPELALHPLVKAMQARQPELGLAVVVDHGGRIRGHADSRLIDTSYEAPARLEPRPSIQALSAGEELQTNLDLIVASSPVLDLAGQTIGTARVGLRRAYVDGIFAEARRQQLFVTVLSLLFGTLAAMVLMTRLLKPISVLRAGLERIGRGDLETPLQVRDVTELGMLAGSVNAMAAELKRAQVEMVDKERLSRELELAREIQDSLLPLRRSVVAGFVVEGTHRAAAEVGGDYFDILPLSGGRLAVAVADVAGKGLGGCMIMSMLSALLRALKDGFDSPAELLIRLDERLAESLRTGSFVTMFYGILDPATGEFIHASAGHCPTLIYRRATGTVEQHRTRGIPLGAIRGGMIRRTLKDEMTVLEPGDMVLQYTDGIYESFDLAGASQYGFERMSELLRRQSAAGAASYLETQRRELDAWRGDQPRQDDETLLVISREVAVPLRGGASTAARTDATARPDPLERLEEARRRGLRLELPATLQAMGRLPLWVAGLPGLVGLSPGRVNLVATALYEACTNIVEHGYGGDSEQLLEIWWLPPAEPGGTSGCLLIRDQGAPFSADNRSSTDFEDPEVRRKGRGFGLEIMHRVVTPLAFNPATMEGNLTIMTIDLPPADAPSRALRHG